MLDKITQVDREGVKDYARGHRNIQRDQLKKESTKKMEKKSFNFLIYQKINSDVLFFSLFPQIQAPEKGGQGRCGTFTSYKK